jgi:hypothetical protein
VSPLEACASRHSSLEIHSDMTCVDKIFGLLVVYTTTLYSISCKG